MKQRSLIQFAACAAVALGATSLRAEDAPKPADAPATAKVDDTSKPADAPAAAKADDTAPAAPAQVSEDAQKVLTQINEAYGSLKTLDLAGKLSSNIEAAGEKHNDSGDFTASFAAPNKFRHALKDDILCGSTGEKAFSYLKAKNMYSMADAAKDKVATKDLPRPLPQILEMQNPSLMLALAKDPSKELTENVVSVAKTDDTKVGDVSCPTLKLSLKNKLTVLLAVDPQTHLVRQSVTNIKPMLDQQGVPDVKTATYTVDYTTTTAGAEVKDTQFAWAPPEGAKDFAAQQAAAADGESNPSDALVGQEAPAFKLTGLDGKELALSDLKGKVVILDFWATWCPPCRASLPHLNKLYDEKKGEGLQVFAVDQQEDKDKVQGFVDKTKLGVPVLLDSNGEVGGKYKVSGIPETVIIGKDGKVKKVFVGFDANSTPEEMHKAVAEAMK
ncbi:MAG TPA: TlpA disulfide reductase family protein [Tepidisphaeraceae bacterium]|jgi:peroxiredoxin/outer membrane lipoprotein-sorting protein|nr:TlpA disulfide reductase family protein [Tepidisphaeraceae bacterium]